MVDGMLKNPRTNLAPVKAVCQCCWHAFHVFDCGCSFKKKSCWDMNWFRSFGLVIKLKLTCVTCFGSFDSSI